MYIYVYVYIRGIPLLDVTVYVCVYIYHILCVSARIRPSTYVCICTHMRTSCKKSYIHIYIHIYIYINVGAPPLWMLWCLCVFMYITYSAFLRVSGLLHMCAFAHTCELRKYITSHGVYSRPRVLLNLGRLCRNTNVGFFCGCIGFFCGNIGCFCGIVWACQLM